MLVNLYGRQTRLIYCSPNLPYIDLHPINQYYIHELVALQQTHTTKYININYKFQKIFLKRNLLHYETITTSKLSWNTSLQANIHFLNFDGTNIKIVKSHKTHKMLTIPWNRENLSSENIAFVLFNAIFFTLWAFQREMDIWYVSAFVHQNQICDTQIVVRRMLL